MPVYRLSQAPVFPDPAEAHESGVLAVGGDLSPQRLLAAYVSGVFPWYDADQPILWWSPDPRLVLFPREFRVNRSLRRTLRQSHYSVTMDRDFRAVITSCAQVSRGSQGGTWLIPEMIDAYERLHAIGIAHSVEVWRGDDLVGGLYGVATGSCFAGESMFSAESGASKIALTYLVAQLRAWSFDLIDCQLHTDYLAGFGAVEISRSDFLRLLAQCVAKRWRRGAWRLEIADPLSVLTGTKGSHRIGGTTAPQGD